MNKSIPALVASTLATLLVASPTFAEDAPPTKEQLLAHPDVMGAIAAIDAYLATASTTTGLNDPIQL